MPREDDTKPCSVIDPNKFVVAARPEHFYLRYTKNADFLLYRKHLTSSSNPAGEFPDFLCRINFVLGGSSVLSPYLPSHRVESSRCYPGVPLFYLSPSSSWMEYRSELTIVQKWGIDQNGKTNSDLKRLLEVVLVEQKTSRWQKCDNLVPHNYFNSFVKEGIGRHCGNFPGLALHWRKLGFLFDLKKYYYYFITDKPMRPAPNLTVDMTNLFRHKDDLL